MTHACVAFRVEAYVTDGRACPGAVKARVTIPQADQSRVDRDVPTRCVLLDWHTRADLIAIPSFQFPHSTRNPTTVPHVSTPTLGAHSLESMGLLVRMNHGLLSSLGVSHPLL